ncbi:MAG: ERF family protein [Paraclostridium sp.]
MIKYSDEIKGMNLWEKIANISAEIENIQKDDSVGFGNNAYKAISIEKVVKTVGEKMNKYGVVIYPIQQQYNRTDEKVVKKDGTEGINRISDVNVTYQVVNIHNPQEAMVTVASGTGVDTQDKGIGKAQTYAYKNMLLKLFAIPTGDDTDKIHSDDYTNKLYGEKPKAETTEDMVKAIYKIATDKGYAVGQVEATSKKDYSRSVIELTMTEYKALKLKVEGLAKKANA